MKAPKRITQHENYPASNINGSQKLPQFDGHYLALFTYWYSNWYFFSSNEWTVNKVFYSFNLERMNKN